MMLACLFLIAFVPFTINATTKTLDVPTTENETQNIQASADIAQNEQLETKPAPLPSSITITNTIKPEMLTYKHWTGKYNPDSFKVFVNETEVAQGATLKVSSETKTVNLKFDYSFVNGKRTGTKTVAYKLNDDITEANISFSWDNDNKIIIDNGTVINS